MGTSLGPLYFALMSTFASVSAWVLMWVTDRLYDWGLGLFAVPIRIAIFFMQLGFLLGCLAVIIGIAVTTFIVFKAATRGLDADSDEALGFKGYMLLLLTPILMFVASILLPLFNMWLDFNDSGLGFIHLGYWLLEFALVYGSVSIILIWIVVLPFFLRSRHASGPASC